jgi:hypothetical protein
MAKASMVKPAPITIRKPTSVSSKALDFAEGKNAVDEAKKSGLVPSGDVRLTANIRADLHLRLKIEAATRRTTVGELIEEMIGEKYES